MALPDGDGFLFHHTCPVANLHLHVDLCDLMFIDLRDGYLFRFNNKKGAVSNKPFIGSAIANRLSLHLATLRMHNGKTINSFRSGCSITMSLIGVSPEDIARHVWWKSPRTAEYYMQTGKVTKMSHAASALADRTSTVKGSSSAAISVANLFCVETELRGFSLIFPQKFICSSSVKGSYLFSEFWREYY